MQKAEVDRLQDRKTADLRYEAYEADRNVKELRFKSLQQSIEADRLQDRKTADLRYEAYKADRKVKELWFKSLQQSIDQILDAVVTETTSDRVYACAKAAAVMLITPNWAGENTIKQCSAIPLFSALPQTESTHFLTSAQCFTDTDRDGSAFANATMLFIHGDLNRSCFLVHHFFCHPSASSACPAANPSMDLAIVRCPEPLPVPSTRLSTLPKQHFQRAGMYGFSDGLNLDPVLMYTWGDNGRKTSLHLKFVRLAPSMQTPRPLNIINPTTLQLLGGASASSAAGSEGAALTPDSYQG